MARWVLSLLRHYFSSVNFVDKTPQRNLLITQFLFKFMWNGKPKSQTKRARRLSDIPTDILVLGVEFGDKSYLRQLGRQLKKEIL